ncbi:type VII secretion protein EccB [Nocardia sp. NPDC003963]
MVSQLTTRAQVNGYRFLLKRYEHAMVRRDVRMLHDPMRSQARSLVIGAVLAVLVVAGAAIMSFLRPQGAVDDAKILVAQESGALFAMINGTLHPVLNLASARLATGSDEAPTSVKLSKLDDFPRGALLGIPGAPAALPGASDGPANWSLCDTVELSDTGSAVGSPGAVTTVIAGRPDTNTPRATALDTDEALLVQRADSTYLIYDGKRARLDMNDPVISRSLRLDQHSPRPVGVGLLNASRQVAPLTPPAIAQIGEPGPGRLALVPIGGVIRAPGVDTDSLYVVLAEGVQPISEFTAEVIRNADSQGMSGITEIPPDQLVGVPLVHRLPIDDFPHEIPRILPAEEAPVSCISWSRPTDALAAAITVSAGRELPLSGTAKSVPLTSADGVGDRLDAVYLPPGTGEYVQATGTEPASSRPGTLFYISDNGIRFGVPDRDTAAVLGLPADPRPAPWPLIGPLVAGPTLSVEAALMSHDVILDRVTGAAISPP